MGKEHKMKEQTYKAVSSLIQSRKEEIEAKGNEEDSKEYDQLDKTQIEVDREYWHVDIDRLVLDFKKGKYDLNKLLDLIEDTLYPAVVIMDFEILNRR